MRSAWSRRASLRRPLPSRSRSRLALDPAHSALSLSPRGQRVLVAAAAWLEGGPGSAKEIALIATLAGRRGGRAASSSPPSQVSSRSP